MRDGTHEVHASRTGTRPSRMIHSAFHEPDTAVFTVRQAGIRSTPVSSVMQLRVVARNSQVTIANGAGQEAVSGTTEAESVQQIPGSRAASVVESAADSLHGADWRATVSVPALEGERYLVELFPSTPRTDSASIELSADGRRLNTLRMPIDATQGTPALFEVLVGAGTISVGPQIERVEIVPTCGTSHMVRSGGRADLYARYEVVDTREMGDIHLPPRSEDARYRAVNFQTKTRGAVRLTYLGRELASAPMPEGCPNYD